MITRDKSGPSLALGLLTLVVVMSQPLAAQSRSVPDLVREALQALEAGDRPQGRRMLEEAIERAPEHPVAHWQLGRLALERGEPAEAIAHLEIAVENDFPRVLSAWYLLGRAQAALHRDVEAIGTYTETLERAPRYLPVLLARAESRVFTGDVDGALADLESIATELPRPPEAGPLHGLLLILSGRTEEARRRLDEEIASGLPTAARARLLRRSLDDPRRTALDLATQLGEQPLREFDFVALGVAWWLSGSVELAMPPLQIAIELDSLDAAAWFGLQQLELSKVEPKRPEPLPGLAEGLYFVDEAVGADDVSGAAAACELLLAQRPHLVPCRMVRAAAAEAQGDLWQALAERGLLLGWLPDAPLLQVAVARLTQTMGLHDVAACLAGRAVALWPERGDVQYLLGVALADSGRPAEALEAIQKAVDSGFDDARAWVRIGDLQFERMEISQSLAAYRRAIELDAAAAEVVETFALSTLTEEQFRDLRLILEAHAEAHPESLNTIFTLALMQLQEGDLDGAEAKLLQVVELAPEHVKVHYNLGQLYLRRGDRERGMAEMARFRELKQLEDEAFERHNRAFFRRVEAAELAAAGDHEAALALYRQSIEEGTAQLEDLHGLGRSLLVLERWQEADSLFGGLLDEAPYDLVALDGMASAAAALGRDRDAETARARLSLARSLCDSETEADGEFD